MNQLKQILFNSISICLLLAILGFATGQVIENYAHQAPNVATYAQNMEQALHQAEKEIDGLFNNGSFLLNAVEGYVLSDSVEKYINKPYTFIIYNDQDSIVYWNNNKVLPFQSDIQYSQVDTIEKYKINESIFLRIRRPYQFLIDGVTYYYNLEGLIPLYRHYSIQNEYLQNYFALMPKEFSNYITISEEETDFSIKDRLGRPIIYIQASESYPYHWIIIFSTILYFLSSFSFLLAIHLIAQKISFKGHILLGLSLFVFTFLLFRLFTIFYDFPLLAHEYGIFNERLSNANNIWFYSLGDFLIDSALLFWLSIYISKVIRLTDIKNYRFIQQLTVGGLGYIGLIGGLAGAQFAMRDIVMSSFISFEFNDFSRLDLYSLLALTGMGIMLLAYFFCTYRFFTFLKEFELGIRTNIGLFSSALGIVLVVAYITNVLPIDIGVFTIASMIHAITLYFFVQRETTSLAWISIWLFLFSTFATIVIENSNTDKGISLRKDFAKALAFERDMETEVTFKSLVPKILDDGFLKLFMNNPLSPSPRTQAIELLTSRYLDNYFFGRYDYSVHIYKEEGQPYRGETRDYESLMNIIKSSRKTISKYLQFYSIPDGQYAYYAKLPITQNGALLGIVIIEFTPKKEFKKSNIYVELLSRNKERLESIYAQFTYAVYKYEERVSTNGSNFRAQLAYSLPRPDPGEYKMLMIKSTNDQKNHLVYSSQYDGSTISIVTVPKLNLFKVFTIFAYIFCFGIFLLFLGYLINYLIFKVTNIKFAILNFENSLREQIQRGIIMVTLTSFVAIAIITISYYSDEYDDYHRSRLLRKISSTARTAVWQIHQNQDSIIKLPDARSLADIHKIDVNIYDLGGNLITSSEKVVFERHLISRKMNPIAFQLLRNEQQNLVSRTEIINDFEYIAAYMPLKDKNEITIAYLNLPYDLAGSNNIGSQDVAEFLGALLNVYVIFLLIAGGAAFFIANSVTNPLSVIGAKLDAVELGKKNEPLIWNNKDEIGELVDRYNHMIKELEESTKKLARSQRESAWREMAKQIAHEIKNPLTPMKLNIQLLERVVNTNPEKAQKMVKRVSNTLIEQIDSLAHIASEFSNFAKMPTANNEFLDINELVRNAYSLFKEEENVQLYLDMTSKKCVVFADKTQIMRVLNNLLKNAVQAIPDDQPGIIKVQLAATSTTAILKVSDNGCGIPKAQEDDIFVPNFTTKSSGTGIGLAMSKTIVEMAKGQIYFESEEGKGTDFFVELPLAVERTSSTTVV
ncbi:sensor histidine kinase [Aureispira sp. CCB-QB1]|uniref:sensor histidine kinase n=1 Tax=Aureispira sp. CCB-QB1 TaxID=1313421 RepID=UPI000697DBF0|nr:sensor histidine kinase [Aureispira sp. CCB-QB1]